MRLVNDGAKLHNIDIPELGVFVEAEAGATVEVTFTVPGSPAAFTWFCSVPGHQGGRDGSRRNDRRLSLDRDTHPRLARAR